MAPCRGLTLVQDLHYPCQCSHRCSVCLIQCHRVVYFSFKEQKPPLNLRERRAREPKNCYLWNWDGPSGCLCSHSLSQDLPFCEVWWAWKWIYAWNICDVRLRIWNSSPAAYLPHSSNQDWVMRPYAQINARMIRTIRVFNVNASAFRGHFWGLWLGGVEGVPNCPPSYL